MKLIIIGAGFGGLRLARKLSNRKGFEILLIDRFNYHQFQPLFYQVATSGLDASNISFPVRKVFQKSRNLQFRMAEVIKIDFSGKLVHTDTGVFDYDVLVLATGADTNFFGNEVLAAHAFPMKSTVEALQLRHRFLHNFEDALAAKDKGESDKVARLMNVVVVGGGPTGVELSGAIAEMKRFQLPKDYPELDFKQMRIYLLEGTNRLLSGMSADSGLDAKRYLDQLGVTVIINTMVTNYDGHTASLNNGESIDTAMLIWAAGIKGNVPVGLAPEHITRGNRILVDGQCRIKGMDDVYAIGDLACLIATDYPNGHPQVAPVATQQADMLARNLLQIEKKADNLKLKTFIYKNQGSMATVGRNLAVVDIPKPRLHFKGFFAWMIWMGLHLMLILGVKNRFFVFCNWLYNYFTYDQNLRLIFKAFYRENNTPVK
jgi:NADH dehydrogenase